MRYPDWLLSLLNSVNFPASPEEILELAVEIATQNATNGGGPFGAVIADKDRNFISAGWNCVVDSCDSTSHAEICALRTAEKKLQIHDLSTVSGAPLTLYTSCAPCIQCFGAIYWAGVQSTVAAASKDDAESAGFKEGPISEALWEEARRDKNLSLSFLKVTDPLKPFKAYQKLNGTVY